MIIMPVLHCHDVWEVLMKVFEVVNFNESVIIGCNRPLTSKKGVSPTHLTSSKSLKQSVQLFLLFWTANILRNLYPKDLV